MNQTRTIVNRGQIFKAAIIGLSFFLATRTVADELPNNLLLRCEGKVSVFFSSVLPKDDKFETTLRLKDGELSDTGSVWLTTRHCALQNAIVHCSANSVVPSGMGDGSERRVLESFIARETGEYNFFLETSDFEGPNATGKLIGNMKLHRTGVCRPISKPIF